MDLSGNVTTVPNSNKIKNCNLVVEVGSNSKDISKAGSYSEDEGKQCLSSMLLSFIQEPQYGSKNILARYLRVFSLPSRDISLYEGG